MASRPVFEEPSARAKELGGRAMELLTNLDGQELLDVTATHFATTLEVLRSRFADTQEHREQYDALLDAVEEWFRDTITPLRFTKSH